MLVTTKSEKGCRPARRVSYPSIWLNNSLGVPQKCCRRRGFFTLYQDDLQRHREGHAYAGARNLHALHTLAITKYTRAYLSLEYRDSHNEGNRQRKWSEISRSAISKYSCPIEAVFWLSNIYVCPCRLIRRQIVRVVSHKWCLRATMWWQLCSTKIWNRLIIAKISISLSVMFYL